MAICTRHPFIQIFKPVLLMALDDYYSDPSQDALARLFDAVNSMDISGAPLLTRQEKIIMRSVERKDVFAEKFKDLAHSAQTPAALAPKAYHRTTNSQGSHSSFEDGIVVRKRERAGTASSVSLPQPAPSHSPPEDSSFSLGGSAVWVGDESELDTTISSSLQSTATVGTASSVTSAGSSTTGATSRGRKSTDASSSSSSHGLPGKDNNGYGVVNMTSGDTHYRAGIVKDTHFFQTTIAYKGHQLPIKMPLSTFPEEVGDVSIHICPCLAPYADVNAVFSHSIDTNALQPCGDHVGSPSSTSAYKRQPHASGHDTFQRSRNRQTHHISGTQSACRSGV